MPGRLRNLSGADVVRIPSRFGFQRIQQSGSHVKLRRIGPDGGSQTLHIPLHRELRTGTLRAIVRQASEYVAAEDLRSHFFAD